MSEGTFYGLMSAIDTDREVRAARLDAALLQALSTQNTPPKLVEALHYSVFPGGARIRPNLCLAVAHADGCDAPDLALGVACSLELLHCASLVHDDLPCFDDALLRRGKPSVHRVFGEPLAVLTGDALIISAFECTAKAGVRYPSRLSAIVQRLAQAVGANGGLVAGQAWESEASVDLNAYHQAKTGSLFVAATTLGALCAGRDPDAWSVVGQRLGAAYQVADDLLDAHANASEGKYAGRDAALGRPNAALELGTAGALERLRGLVDESASAVPDCEGAASLRWQIRQMAERLVPPSLRRSAA
ncbi:MAG: polyprenyl synthetase family protein [Myxococcota bacterium]